MRTETTAEICVDGICEVNPSSDNNSQQVNLDLSVLGNGINVYYVFQDGCTACESISNTIENLNKILPINITMMNASNAKGRGFAQALQINATPWIIVSNGQNIVFDLSGPQQIVDAISSGEIFNYVSDFVISNGGSGNQSGQGNQSESGNPDSTTPGSTNKKSNMPLILAGIGFFLLLK